MKIVPLIMLTLLAAPAWGQSIYKCPSSTPGAPPVIQQMPCSLAGGGETLTVKPIPTGAGSGLSDGAKEYSKSLNEQWAKQAEIDKAERARQDTLDAEHRKAKAAEEQAAAQRETAAAIWATGRRW